MEHSIERCETQTAQTKEKKENNKSVVRQLIQKITPGLILSLTFLFNIMQALNFSSVDEGQIAGWIWKLFENPFPVIQYPPLMLYFHYILCYIYQFVLTFLGYFADPMGFFTHEGQVFMIEAGRFWSALFGTLLVYVVYRIGKDFYNKMTGYAAMLLVGFNQLTVLYSHIFKPDIMTALLLTISLYFVLKFSKTANKRSLFGAAFFYGLAVAAKYNAFPLVIVIFLAIFMQGQRFDKVNLKKSASYSFCYLLPGAAAGFFLGAPNWIVHPIANLKLLISTYNVNSGSLYSHFEKLSFTTSLKYFVFDLIKYFSIIIIVLMLTGMVAGILKRRKTDILLTTFFFLYLIFFSMTSYYGSRFLLPLYAAIAVLVGKILFSDARDWLKRKKPRLVFSMTLLVGVLLSVIVLGQAIVDLYNYNLLQTPSKKSWLKNYRIHHKISGPPYQVLVQMMTSHLAHDIIFDHEFIPKKEIEKGGVIAPHFLQLATNVYDKDQSALNAGGKKVFDMSSFRPFYRVEKSKHQPLDYDVVLLYRLAPDLLKIEAGHEPASFPRTFRNDYSTSFLPLQTYEQSSNFGTTVKGYHSHGIHSKKKIVKIMFYYLISGREFFNLNVNGLHKKIEIPVTKNKRYRFAYEDIQGFSAKAWHDDFIYFLSIEHPYKSNKRPIYFVFYPVYASSGDLIKEQEPFSGTGTPTFSASSPQEDDENQIPKLFSGEKYPQWVKNYYQRTGVDLSLLTYVNRQVLFRNSKKSCKDVKIDFFPLEKGHYILRVEGEKLVPTASPGNKTPILHCLTIPGRHISKKIENTGGTSFTVELEVSQPLSFVELKISGCRKNNYMVNRVILTPDYRKTLHPSHRVNSL